MTARKALALLALVCLGWACPQAQAQDPFAFQFGYVLGYQNSFRNRLPTPPYFAVYPPVYYGARYQRPYGDSPYAAFPQLRSAPDYMPVPKDTPLQSHTVINGHVPHASHATPNVQVTVSEPIASAKPSRPNTVQVINPYAQPQFAASK
jgi:hypothetical protein